ncbi:BamA/TamA family outer membrane protein [Gemmatimonas sp.]|uniref:BamA/OMP85 family outer membrane protein n=1 Tax=Gemmatimonas sp. TaxID=1962908 RepID=UPI00260F17D2|nr:BamA/TamA family outer membrane protein [Gemmatimonas sp.]
MPPRSLPLIAPRAVARKSDASGVVRRWRAQVMCVTIAVAVLLCALPLGSPLAAQRAVRCGDGERVKAVGFEGSPAFDGLAMAATIVTHQPGFATRVLRLGTAPCLDSLEVRRDALRLAILHRQAGWFQASVSPVITRRPDGVRVRFVVTPGREALLDTIRVQGMPQPLPGRRPYDAPLLALQGQRFDRTRVDTTVSSVVAHLRDAGFARAGIPASHITIDSINARVSLDLTFEVGRRMQIGQVHVEIRPVTSGRPRVDSADVARLVAIDPGDRFQATALLDAQRALYRSEAFRLVLMDTVTPATGKDSVLDLRISVAEARTRAARVGLGWATQDCVRVQGRINDRGFLGVGRRVELSARASKIGVGAPTDVAPALCSQPLRDDPFSQRLNYYVGATLTNTRLFGLPLVPLVSVYSERRGEPFAFLRETSVGALAEVSRQFSVRTAGTFGFQYENGKTTTDPVVSCTRFGLCRPEELVLSAFGRGVGIVSTSASHDHTDDLADPSRGWRVRGEVRLGETVSELVSTVRFQRFTGEWAAFSRLFGGVIGARVQAAGAFAPGAELVDGTPLIPQQERLFVGGQNSVRGYQQNLLGAVDYVVTSVRPAGANGDEFEVAPGAGGRAVPRGGTAMLVGNLEWRRGFRFIAERLQFAAFLDAGTLWETRSDRFAWSDLRYTPGLGLRLVTPLGPFRVDIGYRPYGMRAGRALYFSPNSQEGVAGIFCASPRTRDAAGDFLSVFSCPATFSPPPSRSVLSRLVFHFGLGQAF